MKRLTPKFKLCVFLLLLSANIFAQSNISKKKRSSKDTLLLSKNGNAQRDIVDVYRSIFKKKPLVEKGGPSKKSGKLHYAFLFAGGYSLVTRLAAVVAANGAFYTDNEESTKLSAVNTSISYTQNNQIIFPILTNIWTRKNKFNLLGDWRFYKYPEYTYGLGGHTSTKNPDQLNYSNLIFREAVLKHIGASPFYAGLAYNLDYHWNISEVESLDGEPSDFQKYGLNKKSVSSGISLNALYDTRKNSINPSKATYGNITFCPNFVFLGSDHNYRSLVIDFRKYIKPGKSNNVLALWSYSWLTFNGNAPYLDLPSTGWDVYSNTGRGYIQSRFRGKNLLYLEAEYRFGITRNGLLGGVVFTNAQSVTDWPDNKFRVVHPAFGTGIRLKINKLSNTNLSVDYAFGLDGSRGIFINLGEVF